MVPPPFASNTKTDSRSADYWNSVILNYRVSKSASVLPSRLRKPLGSKMEGSEKSTIVDFVRTLPKSCNSKSGLGR